VKTQLGLDLDGTARQIREEITREIIYDLRNNAGTVHRMPPGDEDICYAINHVSEIIHRKTLISPATWLVMHPDTAEKLSCDVVPGEDSIFLWGNFRNWKLITDNLFPDNQILLGAYSGQYASGYAYCPYLLTDIRTPFSDGICPRPAYIVRSAKRMNHSGPKFYGRIVFRD
jgi:hypothetical protein